MPTNIEFHDSTVLAIERDGRALRITLDAYVHRWEQVDGRWRGTGWSQVVGFLLAQGALAEIPNLPAELSGGQLRAGNSTFEGLVPLPFSSPEHTSIRLDFRNGAVLNVSGTCVGLDPLAEGRYVEELPDEFKP